jgi:ABC-2 type transport system permease protein
VIRAKIEVVLIAIGAVFAPFVVALAFVSALQAAITTGGIIIATISAAAIQLWFRVQAKRSQFRRRQTSSRLATFAEAFTSISWAATAALAAAGIWLAVMPALFAVAVMIGARWMSPRQ